jgi:hypothetical protein
MPPLIHAFTPQAPRAEGTSGAVVLQRDLRDLQRRTISLDAQQSDR